MSKEKVEQTRLRSKIISFADTMFHESTMTALAIIALIIFFAQLIIPNTENKFLKMETWMPLAVFVVLLELFFMKTKLTGLLSDQRRSLSLISDSIARDLHIEFFYSGSEFDRYLENRLKSAQEVRVTNMSSLSCSENEERPGEEREDRRYSVIVDNFIKRGGIFHRIFCDTENLAVFKWMLDDLNRYKNNNYFVYLIELVKITKGGRTMDMIIIDDDEICLGAGYRASQAPVLSLRQKSILRFYRGYFDDLHRQSRVITAGHRTDLDYMQNLLFQKQKAAQQLGTAGGNPAEGRDA